MMTKKNLHRRGKQKQGDRPGNKRRKDKGINITHADRIYQILQLEVLLERVEDFVYLEAECSEEMEI